jgi:hypothetical protein
LLTLGPIEGVIEEREKRERRERELALQHTIERVSERGIYRRSANKFHMILKDTRHAYVLKSFALSVIYQVYLAGRV